MCLGDGRGEGGGDGGGEGEDRACVASLGPALWVSSSILYK